MKRKILDTPHFNLELIDEILFVTFKGNITLAIAKELVQARLEISEGKSYPVFNQGIQLTGMDKDARDYLASDEGRTGVNAGALYVDSVFNYFIGNFFLKVTVNKPKIPTQIFNDKQKALKWLEQFK